MKIKLSETLANSETVQSTILRIKKTYPHLPLILCANYVGHVLENLDVEEDDILKFKDLDEEESDEFDGLDFYGAASDLEFMEDYPDEWSESNWLEQYLCTIPIF